MRILLPPSEGKALPGPGAPFDPDELVFGAELGAKRERLLTVLEKLGGISQKRALAALAISAGQAEDIERDAALRSAPAGPAAEVYTGVLYERFGLTELKKSARQRAEQRVLIASALWGFLRPGDRIPYYRLAAKAKLPRVGPLSAYWRPALAETMIAAGIDREGEVLLDLRSSSYAAAWRPRYAELLAVRAFTERAGKRQVISHMAKAVRGDAARVILLSGKSTRDGAEVAEILESAGHRVELGDNTLDIIQTE